LTENTTETSTPDEDLEAGTGGPPAAGVVPADKRILAYAVVETPPPLRRAVRERDWMEATPSRFAYRCLPLVIGNQAGWDILNTVPFRARWNGGRRPSDVVVETLGAADGAKPLAVAHFGEGVLTFSIGYLFRTPPGIDLLVCGPPNTPKDGIFALTGIVETDWTEATFTMNYRFTRRGHWVEFAAGEALCRIIPVDRHLLEQFSGEIHPIGAAPELEVRYRQWMDGRQAFNAGLKNPFSDEAKQGWQRDYFQGVNGSGERVPHHQTVLHHRDFVDRRPGGPALIPTSPRTRNARQRRTWESAAHYLWENMDIYDQRREKFATVLAGIALLLRSRRPLRGAEGGFLDTFERMRQLPAEEFTFIWSEPRAFHWTRVAFQLIDHLVNAVPLGDLARNYLHQNGATDAEEGLVRHLDAFRQFELGATVAFRRELGWSQPLVLPLPCALPGTRWTVQGAGTIAVMGTTAGGLRLRLREREKLQALTPGGIADTDVSLIECPLATCGEAKLRIQPEVMAGLGLKEALPALVTTRAYRKDASAVLTAALQLIEAVDAHSFRMLVEESRLIAPKPPIGDYANTTFSTLPGAMVLSVVRHPLEMADRMVHELHHDRLFCIEEFHALLEEGLEDSPEAMRFYSPWRSDPRPLRGILHGLYVFIAVGRFWLSVLRGRASPEADYTLATSRLRRIGGQLEAAQEVLERNARFTPFGKGVFEQLRTDVATLCGEIDAAAVPRDPPALTITDEGEVRPQLSAFSGKPLNVSEALREHRLTARKG